MHPQITKNAVYFQIWSVCCSIIVLRLVDIIKFTVLFLARSKCLFFLYFHIYNSLHAYLCRDWATKSPQQKGLYLLMADVLKLYTEYLFTGHQDTKCGLLTVPRRYPYLHLYFMYVFRVFLTSWLAVCVWVCFAWKVGVFFVLRILH